MNTILQDTSGSKLWLKDAEKKGPAQNIFASGKEEEKLPDEQKRKLRWWKVLLQDLKDNGVNDNDGNGIVAGAKCQPNVSLKRPTNTKQPNLENIFNVINLENSLNAAENSEENKKNHTCIQKMWPRVSNSTNHNV